MPKLVSLILLIGLGVQPVSAAAPNLTAKEGRGGRVELIGDDGQLRYWVDRFEKVHAPELTISADAYNRWVSSSFSGLFGIDVPTGIVQLISHTPPGPRGIDATTGVFRVPYRIHSDGALTRDLMSVPFFQLGARLVWQWQKLHADCRQILGERECTRFAPDLAERISAAPGPVDDRWLELRLRELQKARSLLQGMQQTLEGVPMVVPGGKVFTYEDDVARYPARLDECWSFIRAASTPTINILGGVAGKFCNLHPELMRHPPEWLAERVEGDVVTPQLVRLLQSFEWQIARYLEAEGMEAELTARSGATR